MLIFVISLEANYRITTYYHMVAFSSSLIEYQYEIKWDLVFISSNKEIDPDIFFQFHLVLKLYKSMSETSL